MTGRFPLFRLATLLARQASTPIASRIKVYARTHPRFSRTVCMGTGRAYHVLDLRFRMWTLALRQPRKLPPISDQAALDSGASILGELVVFLLGGIIIIFEVNRQANKQEDKVLDEKSQWLAIRMSLEELQRELVYQQQDIDRLQDTLRRLAPYQSADILIKPGQPSSPPSDSHAAPPLPLSESPAAPPPPLSESPAAPPPPLSESPAIPPPPPSAAPAAPSPPLPPSPPDDTSEC